MDFIKNQLDGYGMSEQTIGYLSNMIMVVFIAVISMLANFIAKNRAKDDYSYRQQQSVHVGQYHRREKVFHKLSHLVPAIIIYFSASIFPAYQVLIEKLQQRT